LQVGPWVIFATIQNTAFSTIFFAFLRKIFAKYEQLKNLVLKNVKCVCYNTDCTILATRCYNTVRVFPKFGLIFYPSKSA